MHSYVVGIDLGTGSIKAIALDVDKKVLATSQVHYDVLVPQPGYAEQDPLVIWEAFGNCLKKIIDKVGMKPSLIGLSSYMHGVMPVNKKGEPLTNLITWADVRSESIASKLRQSAGAEDLYKALGAPLHSMLPLCKIMWLHEHQPELFCEENRFISIKEYIWHRLFDKYEIDYSVAGATGMFNVHTCVWHTDSLLMCGITQGNLSAPMPPDWLRQNVLPEAAAYLRIDCDTTFCIGGSDGCMAMPGSGALSPGTAAVTIGTSGAVRIVTEKPIFHYPEMVFNYILDKQKFVSGGAVNNGGNVLTWIFKTFWNNQNATEKDYDDFFNILENVPAGSAGLIFLPYIYGERAPIWDEKASGVFVGIRSQHGKAYFSRAALEGICYNLKSIIDLLTSSVPIQQLNVSGGFIHAASWMQMLADVTGKNICLTQSEDASAMGAAFMAMKSAGWIDDYNLHEIKPDKFFLPRGDKHRTYQKSFDIFKQVYAQLRSSLHQLYDLQEYEIR